MLTFKLLSAMNRHEWNQDQVVCGFHDKERRRKNVSAENYLGMKQSARSS